MNSHLPLFASCPKGLEGLLAEEARQLGATVERETVGGVFLQASQATAYTLCLWSRLANRILLILSHFDVADADALYAGVRAIDWDEHLAADGSFAVDFSGTGSGIRNTHFGALRCKDAVVDHFQERCGQRPSINKVAPQLRLNVRLRKGAATVAIDLSGDSLHRRGYRSDGALAPLKENLAAALLLRADWPGMAARGGALIDPMCGSGTLLIEGALMAMDIAPGLLRRRWGFSGWLGHVPVLWKQLLEDARNRRERAMTREWPELRGYDASGKVIAQAENNIERAGLRGKVRVARKELSEFARPTHRELSTGLVITNPPYGERLGDEASLVHLYRHLGNCLRRDFVGWQAALITGNPDLGKRMGLRSHRQYQFYNGSIPSKLLLIDVQPAAFVGAAADADSPVARASVDEAALSKGAQMFANRLRKNLKRLEKWAKKHDVQCYRLYDADMPEYAVAIDRYGDYCHIAEYAPPASIEEEAAKRRLRDVLEAVQVVLEVPPERIAIKERRRQKGREQYRRQDQRSQLFEVREGQARVLVNLFDYLDTGLFLDHRPVRLKIAELARGKRFLNLFCYTGVASVQAGVGGARYTTSVDMSRTYLDWARQNLALNGLSESRHHTVQADCLQWLGDCDQQYDLILLDPPTFSNSKRMRDVLDIQRDHPQLVRAAMRCLSPDGLLIFSNNKLGFKLDEALEASYTIEDKSRWSLDEDFARRSKPIHGCWFIRHR